MNSKFTEFLNEMYGKRVAVLGMGVSNTPLIRLLLDACANVTICDKKQRTEINLDLAEEFEKRGATLQLGDTYLEHLNHDVIFKTPGMRPDMPALLAAKEQGSLITSEMEAFFKVCPCKIIGITGSDGKTTTTTIIYELLRAEGHHCYVGGNIGTPLLEQAGNMTADDICVLELSSFQLMSMRMSPQIAVITNLSPNHLDMHKSMGEYIDAKQNIYRYQNQGDCVVLNYDNEITRQLSSNMQNPVLFSRQVTVSNGYYMQDGVIFSKGTPVLKAADIKIPGLHNVENYLAAIAATEGLVSRKTIQAVAKNFSGVAHRMELVREFHGVSYYNDSIASSPTRTIAGLRAFDKPVILIAGGYDKHIPFDVLGPEVVKHVKKLILVGATTPKIKEAVEKTPGYDASALPIFICTSFEDAVKIASDVAEPGDIVTLSPACASFDLFKNFTERGERFRQLVCDLT